MVEGLKCYEYREVQGDDAGKTELVECSSSQKACFLEIKQYDNPWQEGWEIRQEEECEKNFEQNWVIFTLFLFFFLSCPKSCKSAKKTFFSMGRGTLQHKVRIFWTY